MAIRAVAILLLVVVSNHLYPQFLADPNDRIYSYLEFWEQKGYVQTLPTIRPFPLQLVEQALLEVMEKGNSSDIALAEQLLKQYDNGVLPLPLRANISEEIDSRGEYFQSTTGIDLNITSRLGANFGLSVGGGMSVDTNTDLSFEPLWLDGGAANLEYESKRTGQRVFPIGDARLDVYGRVTGSIFFSVEDLYLQAGIMRSSFGPLRESPVLGSQAPQAGHFSATYRQPWMTLSMVFLELVAKRGVKTDGTVYKLKSKAFEEASYPGKYLIIHSALIHPLQWLEIGLFQSILFGRRISPLYFLPVSLYVQAYVNNWDNAFMGGSLRIDLPFGLRWETLLYVDDLHLSRLLQLNFDTNGNKIALHTGLTWTAPFSIPNWIKANYSMITPYMYSHSSRQPINYLQYTHQARSLGSVLEPNSDQLSIRAYVEPFLLSGIELWFKRIRHGNGSDYGEGSIDGDGSIYDDGILEDGTLTFLDTSSFLTQPTLEIVTQFGIEVKIHVPLDPINLALSGGYTIESVENRGLDPDAPIETHHYFSINLRIGV